MIWDALTTINVLECETQRSHSPMYVNIFLTESVIWRERKIKIWDLILYIKDEKGEMCKVNFFCSVEMRNQTGTYIIVNITNN